MMYPMPIWGGGRDAEDWRLEMVRMFNEKKLDRAGKVAALIALGCPPDQTLSLVSTLSDIQSKEADEKLQAAQQELERLNGKVTEARQEYHALQAHVGTARFRALKTPHTLAMDLVQRLHNVKVDARLSIITKFLEENLINKDEVQLALKEKPPEVKPVKLKPVKLKPVKLGPLASRATGRPRDFDRLPASDRWEIDKVLGILDWDGDPTK